MFARGPPWVDGMMARKAPQAGVGLDAGQADPDAGRPRNLLSPARRRACVNRVRSEMKISERLVCGQHRSTQRKPAVHEQRRQLRLAGNIVADQGAGVGPTASARLVAAGCARAADGRHPWRDELERTAGGTARSSMDLTHFQHGGTAMTVDARQLRAGKELRVRSN